MTPPAAAVIGTMAVRKLRRSPWAEFGLQLHPDEEEEDREQPVGGPGAQAQLQVPRREADLDVSESEVRVREWRVRPDEGGECGDDEESAADGVLAQRGEQAIVAGGRWRR